MPLSWARRADRLWSHLLARTPLLADRPAARRPRPLGVEQLEDRLTPVAYAYTISGADWDPNFVITVRGETSVQVQPAASFTETGEPYAIFEAGDEGAGLGQRYYFADLDVPNGYKIFSITHPILNQDGNVYNTRAFVSREELDVTCDTGCPMPVVDLSPRTAAGNHTHQPSTDAVSPVGVGLESGTPRHSEVDLDPVGESPFGHSRDYSSRSAHDAGSSNGTNWVNPLPRILKRADQDKVFVTGTAAAATTFRKAPYTLDEWRPTLSDQHTLVAAPEAGEYRLTDETGGRYTFYDASPVVRWHWGYGDENGRSLQRHDYLRADSGFSAESSFTVPVTVTGGARKVSLYMADFDGNRSQRVELVDAATDAVLDARDVTDFGGGKYLSWNVSGSAYFRVTKLAGSSAGPRVTGVFFDPAGGASGAYQGLDATTKGTWRGAYGADGHLLASGSTIPSYATASVVGAPAGFYTNATEDPRAVQRHAYDPDLAAWSSQNTVYVTVAQPAAQQRKASLYFLDPQNAGLSARVEVVDAATNAVLDTRVVSGYLNGKYASWNVTGPVVFRVTHWGGGAARVSGVFLDAASGADGYAGEDATTRGAWRGAYGAVGHVLPSGRTLPAGTEVGMTNPTPHERVGRLKSYEPAGGDRLDVTQYTARGEPAEVRRVRGSVVEAWSYAYGTTPVTAMTLQSVTFSRSTDGGLTFAAVQSVAYTYYADGDANGNRNDLRSAVVRDGGPTAPVLRTSYYRYYKPDDPNGLTGQLKYVVTDASFRRLSAATGATLATIDTLADAQVGVYADKYYQYHTSDFAGYVKSVVAQGEGCSACTSGQGTFAYSYARNPRQGGNEQDGDYYPWMSNTWYLRTTETLPDGNQNVAYTNPTGRAMLNVFVESATGRQWRRFTEFDPAGRVVRTAQADAVTGHNESYDDLLHRVDGNYEFLSDTAGQLTEYTFGPSLTASVMVAGDVPGYQRDMRLRHGEAGSTTVLQSRARYFVRWVGPTWAASTKVYPVASETRYPNVAANTPLYADGFGGASMGPDWSFDAGTWGQSGGVMSQTSTGNGESKKALLGGQAWRAEQEVVSSVRIDTWDGSNYAWAGVGVRHDPAGGRGMSLVFNGADTVRFYREYAPFGASLAFPWQVGVWYRVRVRVESGRDGEVLLAKVWEAGQPEPAAWMLRQAAWGDSLPGGGPGLLGGVAYYGYGHMTASFDDLRVEGDEPPGDVFGRTYTWFDGTGGTNPFQAESVTVTAPAVSVSKNGSGVATQATTVYDALGRPVWVRDGGGFLHYTAYDPATGLVAVQIDDVDTALTADFAGLPAGWATPAGGGKHRRVVDAFDRFGRVIRTTSAAGRVTATAYPDGDREARVYPGWTGTAATGPVSLTRYDGAGGSVTVNGQTLRYSYSEELTYDPASVPVDAQGRPTGAEAVSNIKSLSRVYYSQSGQAVWRDDYFNLTGLSYLGGDGKPTFALGTAAVHFLRTTYGYDHRGRQNRVQSPAETITRTVYDGQDRVVSTWVGTNDVPTSGFWSPTNAAGMVKVSEAEYDGGGVGNGNTTKVIEFPNLGVSPRVTQIWFDWRSRPVAAKHGGEATEAADVNRPISYTEYDNLGHTLTTEWYDGDAVTVMATSGVPVRPSAGLLRAKESAAYDELGRVYRQSIHSVDPSTGAVAVNTLRTDTWYDGRGQVVKTAAPGGLVRKTAYDGTGQVMVSYVTDGGGDSGYAAALNVAGDVVLEQVETEYDADGNAILSTARQRFHDETGTGALGNPATGVKARMSTTAGYYDLADRLVAFVDVGTNGGAAWTRPDSVPARSDAVLVTSTMYDAAGRAWDMTNSRGLVRRTEYDLLGRAVRTVENYVDGTPSDADDKTTEYTHGPAGITSLTAKLTGGGGQTTEWVYGVTAAGGSGVDSNDVVRYTRWPDATTGAASSSEQDAVTVNALGQTATSTDRNGTVHSLTYDALGRVTADAVTTLGTGVDGAVRRVETGYDTRGNAALVTSYSLASGGAVTSQVKRDYDGLGQLASEWQAHGAAVGSGTPRVQYGHSFAPSGTANQSRPASVTYPDGRVVTRDYGAAGELDDRIGRLAALKDSTITLEDYSYLGHGTVVARSRPESEVNLTYAKLTGEADGDGGDRYAGLDRFGRVVDQRWVTASAGAAVDRYQYGHDRGGNRVYRDNLLNSAFGELYTYDGLNQVTGMTRGTLNGTKTGVTGAAARTQGFDYDATGNFDGVATDGTTQSRTANRQNEVTGIGGATTPAFDAAGNMTGDEAGRVLVYDAWNRLVAVKTAGGVYLASYGYDGMGRRVSETYGSASATDLYYSADWQVLEEQVGGVARASYVWSPVYVDALIARDRDADGSSGTGPGGREERLYALQDANWNTTALLSTTGTVVERFVYDAFGAATVLDATFMAKTGGTGYAWRVLFQGMSHDAAAGLSHQRARWYSPSLGRWASSDPIQYHAKDVNLYRLVSNAPTGKLDPSGLKEREITVDLQDFSDTDWIERRMMPGNTQWSGGNARIDKIQSMIESKLKDGDCISELILTAHNSTHGQVYIGPLDPVTSNTLTQADGSLHTVESAQKLPINQRKKIEFLYWLKSKMCKGSTIYFVQCHSGSGPEGKKLNDQLQELTGNDSAVVMYDGTAAFWFGIPGKVGGGKEVKNKKAGQK